MVKRKPLAVPPARAAATPIDVDDDIAYLSDEEDDELRENPDNSGAAQAPPNSCDVR